MRGFLQKLPIFLKQFSTFLCGLLLFPPSPAVHSSKKRPPFLIITEDKEGRPYDFEACGASLFYGRDGVDVLSDFGSVRRCEKGVSSVYFKLSALARRLSISAL